MLPHHKLLVAVAIIIIFLIVIFTSYSLRKQTSRRQHLGNCTLPKQYANGEYSGNYTHGQTINKEAYIRINCNANYVPYPSEQSICLNNIWSPEFPRCVRTCPAIAFDVVEISCELDGINEDCSKSMREGTIAHMKCKELFVISQCRDGYWSNKTAFDKLLSQCSVTTKSLPALIKSRNGCVLPKEFSNGKYTLTGNYTRGQPIGDETYVRIQCNATYAPYPTEHCACLNNSWSPEFPICVKTCPAITSDIVEISCKLNNTKEDCTKSVLEGTIAHMKCKNYYESLGSSNPLSRCVNGSWDIPIIKCTPECGRVISSGQTAIIDGVRAVKGNFPWHVAIYRRRSQDTKYKNICGGSIISRTVILSAAHCFARDEDGLYTNASYVVGAGKYYGEYESPWDHNAQYIVAQQTLIQSSYGGHKSNYQDDIAIVIVEKPFEITQFVQPICIDWSNEFESLQLRENANGTVVGWGYTKEEGNPANELQQLTVPYKSRGACLEVVPDNFHRFVTTDKFCAGFTNGSAVCQGDSGGGLVFYWPRNRRYYIRGIVSISPINQGTCHSHQLTAYTRITNELLLWISRAESENRFWYSDSYAQADCTLPKKILNGKYTVFGNYISGEPVSNGTIVTIQCNTTYAPYPASFTSCLDNRWSPKFPKCVRTCQAIISNSVDLYCELDGHEEVCTMPMVEGTIVHMKCKDSYTPLDIDNSASLCEGGYWDTPFIKCTAGENETILEGCTLPRQILNGNYTVQDNIIIIDCNKNFEAYPSKYGVCLNNSWALPIPKCVQTCPALISDNAEILCTLNDLISSNNCTRPVPEGTVAHMRCISLYHPVSSTINPINRCEKGSWDIPVIRCAPDCGEEILNAPPLIINGYEPSVSPWHVAVYRIKSNDTRYICSGLIISLTAVVSPAHCFFREYGLEKKNTTYMVEAGRYYSELELPLDHRAQHIVVQQILIPTSYREIDTNYKDDISIVILEKPLQTTEFVHPICLGYNNGPEISQMKENDAGYVVGSEFRLDDFYAVNELKQRAALYIRLASCLTKVPKDNFHYTRYKFCAEISNVSVFCKGPGVRGGLGFYWPDDRNYSIHGILNIYQNYLEHCEIFNNVFYTRITNNFFQWLSNTEIFT